MADGILQAFRNNHELQCFVLSEVRATGRKLGEGSYGSVEELKVKGLVCAGKRLHKALVEQGNAGVEKIVSRFLEECKMMAGIRHPHIVQFLGLCYLEGSALPVLVMEQLDRSLDDLLETSPGLPLTLKQSLLTDVAQGLLYLHTHNPPIIHRDLSARNVLLTSSLVAKISDLGCAHIVNLQPGQLAKTLTRVPGAHLYMPPESFDQRSRYGPRLDIFSFGHLALFTLTQKFPDTLLPPTYPEPNNSGHLLARSEVERRSDYIELVHEQLGEQHPLSQLVSQCLHNIPAQRPSAEELHQRLEAVRPQIEEAYGSQHVNVEIAKLQVTMMSVLRTKDAKAAETDRQQRELLTALREERGRLQAEIGTKNAQLQQKDGQLQERTNQINRQQRELRTIREDNRRLQVEVRDKDTQLRERNSHLNKQQTELKTLREDRGWLQAEVEAKAAEIDRQQRELQTVREERGRLQTEIEAKNAQLQWKDGRLQERTTQINRQQRELRTIREDNRRLQVEVRDKDTQLRERNSHLNKQQTELKTLREDRGRLQAEVEAKAAEIDRQRRELQTVKVRRSQMMQEQRFSSGGERKTSNGCEVAKRVPRKKSSFRIPSGNIAAIHLGKAKCSVAYTTVGSGSEEGPRRLPLNTVYYHVPTAIQFNPDGSIDSFGYDARAMYLNLDDEDRLEYAYFEEITKYLHDENVNRNMIIRAKNGKEYHLVDVIAQVLKYLKIELIENHLQRGGHCLEATDFDWVITVPAIWRARGKQMMREAGYKAGLCSQETCGNLREASASWPILPNEKDPDKLSLALEQECAAIYCQSMSEQQVAYYCPAQEPFQSTCYLVVDIGSGTVDISAYRVSSIPDQHVEAVHPPTGNDCGGSSVNKEFQKFLEELVNDKGFSRYLQSRDPVTNAKHSAHLNELVNKTFEDQKVVFGSKGGVGLKTTIRLPYTFLDVYKGNIDNSITRMKDSRLRRVGHELRIEYSMMADFFQPVVGKIFQCISQTLNDVKAKVDTIYLVGRFGGSQYIYKMIHERFGDSYKYITPAEPDFAVIRGAVLFHHNPDIVYARKADATYTIGISIPFNPTTHDPEYKWVDDDGKVWCSQIFKTVVERGDLVYTKEVFHLVFEPTVQTSKTIKIYSTSEKDAKPVEIGEFVMPNLTGDENHKVDITFDLSHTEIQVKACDRTSGNEVKVTLDFLSVL